MVVWSRKAVKLPDGRNNTVRMSHLMRSTDEGKTWTYFSTVGPGGNTTLDGATPDRALPDAGTPESSPGRQPGLWR